VQRFPEAFSPRLRHQVKQIDVPPDRRRRSDQHLQLSNDRVTGKARRFNPCDSCNGSFGSSSRQQPWVQAKRHGPRDAQLTDIRMIQI
jgi:hypothetical protein